MSDENTKRKEMAEEVRKLWTPDEVIAPSELAPAAGSGNEEQLRAEIARLRWLLKEADWRITEHHSSRIMRDERNECPVCTGRGMDLLLRISRELRADAGNSPNHRI